MWKTQQRLLVPVTLSMLVTELFANTSLPIQATCPDMLLIQVKHQHVTVSQSLLLVYNMDQDTFRQLPDMPESLPVQLLNANPYCWTLNIHNELLATKALSSTWLFLQATCHKRQKFIAPAWHLHHPGAA